MKRILSSLLALVVSLCSIAQITITVDDLLDVGDSAVLAVVNSAPTGFDPGPAGPNQHWDFTNLHKDTVNVLKFISPADTPYGSEFPFSNVAVEGFVEDLGVQGWAYGTRNAYAFTIDGAGGSYDTFEDIVVPFDPPEVMFDFPVNYLDSRQQTSIIDVRIDSPEPTADSIRVKISTTVDSQVDAWGEISTPVWTGQVLRFRDVRTTIDSVWIKVLFLWIFLESNENIGVMYKYMANDVGYPVMTFNADTSDTNFSGINYHLDAGVGETELAIQDQLSFEVFPNPANDVLTCQFEYTFEGELHIYDIYGRQVYQKRVTTNQQQARIDVSAFPKGMYQLVAMANGKLVSAKKVVVY